MVAALLGAAWGAHGGVDGEAEALRLHVRERLVSFEVLDDL